LLVKSQLKEIFHEIAPEIEFDKLDLQRSLKDQVEIDSFDFYRIIVLINTKLGVNVPNTKMADFKNLMQLTTYILEVLNSKQSVNELR
jgi:acyl carrier protein